MDYENEFILRTAHYIIMGFSIVVGLSWNDTIKHFLNHYVPIDGEAIAFRIAYCIFITLGLVFLIKHLPNTTPVLKTPYLGAPVRTLN